MTNSPPANLALTLPDRPIAAQIERSVSAHNVTKIFNTDGQYVRAVDDVSFRLKKGKRLGILGGNGAGKSTLIKLLAGVLVPTSGYVDRGLSLSWPLALGNGFFEGHLTGYDNIRFISKLYKQPFDEVYAFVSDFSELSTSQMMMPVRFYSQGMMMRLAFALSLSVDFECLLIDEVIVVGDRRFQLKCLDELFVRRKDRAIILAIHASDIVKQYCDAALVMKGGRARLFHDLDLAIKIYNSL